MRTWSNNIEAVARTVCAKRLAHRNTSEEQLAADMDLWWHLTTAELECGFIDETGEYVGDEIDWERKMDGYRARYDTIPRTVRHGRPPDSGHLYARAEAFRDRGRSRWTIPGSWSPARRRSRSARP